MSEIHPKVQTLVHEVSINDLVAYYLKELKLTDSNLTEISRRWFLDPNKGLCVIIHAKGNDSA